MIERSALVMYAVAAGAAIAFYAGPFRYASALMATNTSVTRSNEAVIAEAYECSWTAAVDNSLDDDSRFSGVGGAFELQA